MEDLLLVDSLKSFIETNNIKEDSITQTEIEIKYSGYINKEKINVEKLTKLEKITIPEDFDYKNFILFQQREGKN